MVNVVTVENNDCVFWNVHFIVDEVLGGIVGCGHPKRRVHALYLRKCEIGISLSCSRPARTSLMMARMYGRRCSSSTDGQESRPITVSSSACAFAWTSGYEEMRARNH